MRRALCWLPLAGALACSDPPGSPSPAPVISISPTTQWSGGEVRASSSDLKHLKDPISLRAEGQALAVTRVNDTTVTLLLPKGSTGPVQIDLVRGNRVDSLATVGRVGFREHRLMDPGIAGFATMVWEGGTIRAVGDAYAPGPLLVSVDMETLNTIFTPGFSGLWWGTGLSPTYRPGEYVALDSVGNARVVRLWPQFAVVDSFTAPGLVSSSVRHKAFLSDSVWLQSTHHQVLTYLDGSVKFASSIFGSFDEPQTMVLSPRKDLAAVILLKAEGGFPVFQTATGDLAYQVPGYVTGQAAAFSPDGSRLNIIAGPQNQPDSLLSLRAETGEILASVSLDAGTGFGLTSDPEQPLLYVMLKVEGKPTIRVYSSDNLTLLGELPTPASVPFPSCGGTCWRSSMGVDRIRNRLYVLWEGTSVWTFDLLP